jgi:hypothetical protein
MRSSGRAFWVLLPLLVAACGVDKSSSTRVGTKNGTLGGPSVSTDHAGYLVGATITVTYAGLPGNAGDWIAIATAGSDNTNYVDYVYATGVSGTATFTAPAAGSYVARAFAGGTYNLLAASPTFSVVSAPTISTNQSSYAPGATITVTYVGLPGTAGDWIAIATAGSDNTNYVDFVYATGANGTATFTAPGAGSYVARAFAGGGYDLVAQSATFTVGVVGGTISTDQSTYPPGATITVTYDGLPGTAGDWIALATAGSDSTSYVDYVYASGASGTATFTAPGAGSYVTRAFAGGSYNLVAQSATFTVGVVGGTISTDQSSYAPGATITVTYGGLPGTAGDWIALATAGSDNTSFVDYVYASGASGTATFTAPSVGSYVARAFAGGGYNLVAQSATFTVVAAGPATISTDQSNYLPGATITVTYGGLPGNAGDWITISSTGSDNTTYVDYVYATGVSGSATFTAPAAGSYVARAFAGGTYNLLGQSGVFTTCDAGMTCFVAALSGAEEVPANSTTATGSGFFSFDPGTSMISYSVQHTVVGAVAGHIHQAPAGVNGSVIVPFTLVGQGASGVAVLSEGQAADLLVGNLYTNIHSPTFPGGEVRGQILPAGHILFVSNLDGAQEVGPTGSTATGTGSVIFDPATNNIIYRVQHTVVGAVAGHIHQAPVGVNGPVIVPFTLVGQGASGTATLTSGQATDLQALGLYMNIHSSTFPGGEVRGVLHRPGT